MLCDVSMPEMDGFALVREVRQRWPEVACVMLSAHPARLYWSKAKAAGAVGYVEKGSPHEMVAAV